MRHETYSHATLVHISQHTLALCVNVYHRIAPKNPLHLVSSTAGDAEDGLQLLENDQLKARGRGEAGPNWDEAGVQTARPVLRHNLHAEENTDYHTK